MNKAKKRSIYNRESRICSSQTLHTLFCILTRVWCDRQGEIKLVRIDILSVKVPERQRRATKKAQNEQTKDVKPVEHKGQKRKLVITNDGTVYKFKNS